MIVGPKHVLQYALSKHERQIVLGSLIEPIAIPSCTSQVLITRT